MSKIQVTEPEKMILEAAYVSTRLVARNPDHANRLNSLARKGWLEKRNEPDNDALYTSAVRDYYYITHNGRIVAKALGLTAVER